MGCGESPSESEEVGLESLRVGLCVGDDGCVVVTALAVDSRRRSGREFIRQVQQPVPQHG